MHTQLTLIIASYSLTTRRGSFMYDFHVWHSYMAFCSPSSSSHATYIQAIVKYLTKSNCFLCAWIIVELQGLWDSATYPEPLKMQTLVASGKLMGYVYLCSKINPHFWE